MKYLKKIISYFKNIEWEDIPMDDIDFMDRVHRINQIHRDDHYERSLMDRYHPYNYDYNRE